MSGQHQNYRTMQTLSGDSPWLHSIHCFTSFLKNVLLKERVYIPCDKCALHDKITFPNGLGAQEIIKYVFLVKIMESLLSVSRPLKQIRYLQFAKLHQRHALKRQSAIFTCWWRFRCTEPIWYCTAYIYYELVDQRGIIISSWHAGRLLSYYLLNIIRDFAQIAEKYQAKVGTSGSERQLFIRNRGAAIHNLVCVKTLLNIFLSVVYNNIIWRYNVKVQILASIAHTPNR